MQILLSAIGKTRFGSLSDTILALEAAPEVSTGLHRVMFLALVLSLAVVLPLSPIYGFFLFLVLSLANVTIYYAGRDRRLVEAYLDCFSSLLRMLGTADKMETVDWPEVREQMAHIREGKKSPFTGCVREQFFSPAKMMDREILCRFLWIMCAWYSMWIFLLIITL